ncbi:EamA family transporter [Streptomyces rugosispiralis]|uniref:DMT family transporter n=1 Tax=Streptomyces rugosispiralis TaxID=2967341 RepID=A0ABT1V671_9ACTN|nr:EamA family transporter [Streptomyces rugosispiralis]MCQ8192878.1 DMT family transporter [Streptomyces rugosispiralis]
MGELLAVASALCFGTTHFLSGLVSRHRHGVTVAACAQAGGTVVSLVPVLLTQGANAPPAALGWGALSGLGTGVGVACLYWSMNQGPMSVVVPVSDVTAVGLPVLAGIALLGDRPSPPALTGIALGLPALWLVSRGESSESSESHEPSGPRKAHGARPGHGQGADRPRPAVVLALVAGVGLALHFFALARIPAAAGWWPVVVSRAVSVAVILALFPATGASLRLPRRAAAVAAVAGALGTLATILYLLATRQELLSVAVVLSALYPAVPVLLALTFLRERITRPQTVGLLGAALAIGLIALN